MKTDITNTPLARRAVLLAALAGAAWPRAALTCSPAPWAWPEHLPVPGGVARINLEPALARPQAFTGEVPLFVLRKGWQGSTGWTALVGIPLSATPGLAHIRVGSGVTSGGQQRELAYTIVPKRYAEQQLKVAPGSVDLSPADLARHERERAHQQEVIATFSDPLDPYVLWMDDPVPGPRSSSFGLRRVFNGQPRSPHSGIDIAAPAGTLVVAPLAATVIDTGDYFFNGLTVWLDHGGGLLSMLCHLSRIDVRPGQRLRQKDPVGAVGASGRATGAHLHWTVCLNRTPVDPELFTHDPCRRFYEEHR